MPYLIRSFIRRTGSSATVILMLALAIDANTANYSVAKSVIFLPLPFPKSDRLVLVFFLTVGADPDATEEAIRLFDCAVFDLRLRSS
jgi:hypothetical protein